MCRTCTGCTSQAGLPAKVIQHALELAVVTEHQQHCTTDLTCVSLDMQQQGGYIDGSRLRTGASVDLEELCLSSPQQPFWPSAPRYLSILMHASIHMYIFIDRLSRSASLTSHGPYTLRRQATQFFADLMATTIDLVIWKSKQKL